MIEINQRDLYLMLSSAIRYALPRQTYICTYCEDWCKAYAHHLTPTERQSIIKDIKLVWHDICLTNRPIWLQILEYLI